MEDHEREELQALRQLVRSQEKQISELTDTIELFKHLVLKLEKTVLKAQSEALVPEDML